MTRCFISLGSNLEDSRQHVETAIAELQASDAITAVTPSPWFRSTAIGPGEQSDYINGVAELHTELPPLALLDLLQGIEQDHNRLRVQRWGPRTLDLDLLLYGDQFIDCPRLQVPHPRIYERNFVLYPLRELTPTLIFPDGSSINTQLKQCPANGISPLTEG